VIHTAQTARALVIGEVLATQIVAMRVQRIGARALEAYLATHR
jgi:hypothetical protein